MATLTDVLAGLVDALADPTSDLYVQNQPVCPITAKGWPPKKCLDALSSKTAKQAPMISVTGLVAKDVSRFMPDQIEGEDVAPSVVVSLDKDVIATSEYATLTIAFAEDVTRVAENDAIGLGASLAGDVQGATIKAAAGSTLTTLATALAAAINARATLNGWISATAIGATIRITCLAAGIISIRGAVGNIRTDKIRFHRELTRVDINVWAGSEGVKDLLADAIQIYLAGVQREGKFVLSSGEVVKLRDFNRFANYQGNVGDIYRETFLSHVEYAVTEDDYMYTILVLRPSVSPL